MRIGPAALGMVLAAGLAAAQETPPAAPVPGPPTAKDVRHRMGLIATRAIAWFRSADSIEEGLRERGMMLNTELVVLRVRLEAALDQADGSIEKADWAAAGKTLDRAQALLDRFAEKLGG